ncbi:hypothetical protein C8Q70DRAFT_923083 [Cubamyces menziesii]|nr:hypothetical protein C8Q70DRAFT_923083 [Cubamyces menziesii]
MPQVLKHSITEGSKLHPQKNGFVHTVLEAYGRHNHLRIRPDDVWIAILTQLSFYVNAHAEALRGYFVEHTGKRRLVVEDPSGNRFTLDYEAMVRGMTQLIRESVVDATLVEWMLPDFTTTSLKDTTICSIAMMSTLREYFEYTFRGGCGIPTVTLDGTKADWQRILNRLERLYDFGDEPSAWAHMLGPIIQQFIAAFDGQINTKFWEHIVYHDRIISGPNYISGWITAFCVWDNLGKWHAGPIPTGAVVLRRESSANISGAPRCDAEGSAGSSVLNIDPSKKLKYTLDGISFPAIDFSQIPTGCCTVDVLLDDNGKELDCSMVAGHVAAEASASVMGGEFDTLSPAPQWFLVAK